MRQLSAGSVTFFDEAIRPLTLFAAPQAATLFPAPHRAQRSRAPRP